MKLICPRIFTAIALLIISLSTLAQKDTKDIKKYKEEADNMRKEVWGWNKPEFKVRTIPAEYASASKIVIARHMEINADSKKRAKLTLMGVGAYRELMITEIAREAIKINDKSAISDYSEIAFTQIVRSSGFFIRNSTNVYIGVRIIKPDGSIKEISADDIVLTRNESSKKEAKLAIPDLQVGDIVDYFLAKQQNTEQSTLGDVATYAFTLFDDAPIMHYSIHIEMGKKYAIEYRCYNKAPDFKRSTSEDDDNVFDLVQKNIPAYTESGLWVSAFRQLPIIRMNIKVGYKGMYAGRFNAREPGKVYANPPADEFIEDEKIRISSIKEGEARLRTATTGLNEQLPENASKYYFELLKNKDKLPFDSVVSELFYLFRYTRFLRVEPYADINGILNRTKEDIAASGQLYDFGNLLKSKDFEYQLVFVTPKAGPYLKEILSSDDIKWMLSVEDAKPKLFGMSDIFSPAFYISPDYEDAKQAMTMRIIGKKKNFDEGTINIPRSPASANSHIEKLVVTPLTDGTNLMISRQTILKGHYKSDVQKKLILFEDYCNAERKMIGENETIIQELESKKNKKSYAPELKIAFDKERSKQKDAFVDEAKEWFEQEVTELSENKVENMGVRHTNPDFVYSSKFKLGGVLKKAGNNLILEVGKLQGTPLTLSASQRKRSLDIYMPFARSMQTEITLQIPEGYTVEGVEALNKKVENETGYFICEASSDSKAVTIKVKKSYNNSFEPVANWDKLLAFIDAANDWTNAKLLLKKK